MVNPITAERLAALPAERVVELDVRDDLRNGREPFSRIMAARRELPAGGALRLRAIFEPVPLYRVMEKQGLAHHTEQLAPDDWVVWFHEPDLLATDSTDAAGPDPSDDTNATNATNATSGTSGTEAAPAAARQPDACGATADSSGSPEPVVLDVRGLEPPEPMVRTLEALAELPPGGTLIQLNVRVPQLLLPQLEARGYSYTVHEEADDRVRVLIHAPAT